MDFITDNWQNILAVLGALYVLATVIAAITPSDRDDTWVAWIGLIADRLGVNLKGSVKIKPSDDDK